MLVGIARHDEASLAALYDRYHRLAFSLALRVVNDRGRAEDVVQDAFLSVWRKAGTFVEGRGSVKTWLTSIVRNRAIDVVRARRESDADDESVLLALRDGAPSVVEQVTTGLDRALVRAAVQSLPAEQQHAISMAYFEGRSHSEIAEVTGLPLGTVKSRIRLAMSRLRDALVLAQVDLPAPAWTDANALFSGSDAATVTQH
ncbi:MAG: sigma-70 family RNA polymerase sigma factor [Chloroflexi bacterium]|nr:sigma-70 family RNA polymerase sigma factor [Chloroflexota bacterium]